LWGRASLPALFDCAARDGVALGRPEWSGLRALRVGGFPSVEKWFVTSIARPTLRGFFDSLADSVAQNDTNLTSSGVS
jgi:hypothetical protein